VDIDINDTGDDTADTVEDTAEAVSDAVSDVAEAMADVAETVAEAITDAVEAITDAVDDDTSGTVAPHVHPEYATHDEVRDIVHQGTEDYMRGLAELAAAAMVVETDVAPDVDGEDTIVVPDVPDEDEAARDASLFHRIW
jgi:hypothetical protein